MFKIFTCLAKNKTIYYFQVEDVNVKLRLKNIIYITKTSIFLSNIVLANFFFDKF